jgi:CoA:oxalate CoA-transferase
MVKGRTRKPTIHSWPNRDQEGEWALTQLEPADSDPPLPAWRVLELSQLVAGPYAGRILSDLGADVVKLEGPRADMADLFGAMADGRSGLYAQMNAGKRSIAIDLSVPAGADLARALADQADVLIENFRPGVVDRLGLGYRALAATNPRLVMLSVSGFGSRSPDATRRAVAPAIHAESGLLRRYASIDGREPSDVPLALADTLAGLHGAIAVLAALHKRAVTGRGQHIDLSMLAAMAASDDYAHAALDGNTEPYPSRGLVWQAPGGPLLIAASLRTSWVLLHRHVSIADPAPPGSQLPVKAKLRRQAIQDWISGFADRAALLAELEAAGLIWAELRDSAEVFARGAQAVRPPGASRDVVAMPYHFSAATATVRRGVPGRGEHNADALADWLGLDDAAVSQLTASGALLRS